MSYLRGQVSRPKKSVEASCNRCGGSGRFFHYGSCFRCGGSGRDPSEKDWIHPAEWSDEQIAQFHEKREARNQKSRDKAHEKRLAKRAAKFAENAEQLPELLDHAKQKNDWYEARQRYIKDHKIIIGRDWHDYGECINEDPTVEAAWVEWYAENEPVVHHILEDLFSKAHEWDLSDKQCYLYRNVLSYFQKNQADRQARREASSHQGVIGEKLEVTAKVTFIKYCCNDWGGTTLIKATDEHGNVFLTFYSGSAYIPEKDETVLIKGRVKDHDEYDDVPQTVLTRCRFFHPEVLLYRSSIKNVEACK